MEPQIDCERTLNFRGALISIFSGVMPIARRFQSASMNLFSIKFTALAAPIDVYESRKIGLIMGDGAGVPFKSLE